MGTEAQAAFFSYSREDSEFALRLAEDLKTAGANVWMDQLDIEPGMPWDWAVEDALTNCPRMLVVLSPTSVKSEHVRDEISFALGKQKRIIPVLYRECAVPFRLARLQHIDFRTDYARGLKTLLKTLSVNQQSVGVGQAAVVPPESPVKIAAGTVRVNPKDGQRYVWIPPGSFMMGCSPGDSECFDKEKPTHRVTLTKGFWIGQTAVTAGAWKRYRIATETKTLPTADSLGRKNWNEAGDENMPAVMMTWDEAKSYCEWAGMRLPTEAEWEYAARAGATTARYGDLDSIAWYSGNSGTSLHAVGLKQPNAWNLYDMLGNVWEWTADWYDAGYYAKSEPEDPPGSPRGKFRVVRGGSWGSNPVRFSYRNWNGPGDRNNGIGCRCVGELP